MSNWPRLSELDVFYGEPGDPRASAGMVELPFPMTVAWAPGQTIQRFRCHELVQDALHSILAETKAHYGEDRLHALRLDVFGGCYSYQPATVDGAWPLHAWGIALSIDPQNNMKHWGGDRAAFAIADCRAFWDIAESHGAVSRGRVIDDDWGVLQFARFG